MASPAQPRAAQKHPWLVLSVVLTAAFMDLVDGTIVSIVLPHIQSDLEAGFAAAQWVLAGYSLTFALMLIPGGRLGDVYGRKRIFLIGVAGFTLASIVCGAATGPGLLVGGRLLQGFMAALMVPQVISIIMVMFMPERRAKPFAVYGIVLSLANVSGPLLGALLTEYDVFGLQWRAIFLVNVPVGLLAFVGAARYMPESRSEQALKMDVPGTVLITLASFALMLPLIQGRESGWPLWMILLMIATLPLLGLFALAQRRSASPLVPPGLFKERSFVVGLIMLLTLFTGLASFFLVINYALQLGLGWSLLATALTGIGWPVGILVTSGLAQRYATTHGRLLIRTGLLIMTVAVVALIVLLAAYATDISYWVIAPPVLVMGLGFGLCVSILTNVILTGVPADSAGAGSGVLNAMLQLGTAAGIAIVGVIFVSLANGQDTTSLYFAASTTLWYNAAVFLVALLLAMALPPAPRGTEMRESARQVPVP
ncbi:MFS transporter [Nonomuraea sp. NPDC050680]|uniref:MFS transporter n=1 Tax=Nonomuraea sp. NPDC050680 TaxID=3154630 RepID=UPI0033DBA467